MNTTFSVADSAHIDVPVAPFWYDLWAASGSWSKRVERVWAKETAYRGKDRSLLAAVLPTLAPEQRAYVDRVLMSEGKA